MASNGESFFRLLCVAARPRELTGAVGLISHYQLGELYKYFCKKALHSAISESKFLSNAVGDIDLRRGEGMELCQLVQIPAGSVISSNHVPFRPFDIEVLQKGFTLEEVGPIALPESESGLPTVLGKKEQDEEKKINKQKHRSKDRDKYKEKDKKKKRDKDKREKDKDRSEGDNGDKEHKKKNINLERNSYDGIEWVQKRHDGEAGDDVHKHKSKKHKHFSRMVGQTVLIKNGKGKQ